MCPLVWRYKIMYFIHIIIIIIIDGNLVFTNKQQLLAYSSLTG